MTMIHLRSMGLLIALSVLSSPAIAQGSGSSDALQPPPPTAGEIAPLGAWSPEFDSNSGTSLNAILNMEVFSSEGRKIGQIDNVLFDADGQAEAVIARVGGFSGITDGQVSVAWKFLEINASSRRITMPITLENLESYLLPVDSGGLSSAKGSTGPLAPGAAAGQRSWSADELIGDYVRVQNGSKLSYYGYVDDILLDGDRIAALVIDAAGGFGPPGRYLYPFHGPKFGWIPDTRTYDLPYDKDEIGAAKPLNGSASGS
jgi:sporulation protein YlmC with PRC-barrel domain